MSDPAIYIELQGTTRHVPPPSIIPKSVSGSPPQSANRWCGIPKPPYPIRNSEFRNQDSGFGKAANYGAVCRISLRPP